MEGNRESFGSTFGALMAMAGSAIGLGNLWRFPYMAGVYGGGAFILLYLIMGLCLCLPILTSEVLIGRRSQSNPYGAFKKLAPGTGWKWVGAVMVLTTVIIVSYYSVIGGWTVHYLVKALCLDFTVGSPSMEELGGIFGNFISSTWTPLAGHAVFIGITAFIVLGGVRNGIEKFGNIMMPILFVIVIIIAIRSCTLPGAMSGIEFLFKPDFSKLTPEVWVAALGQGFFSLSTGCGVMLTYGSYVSKKDNIGTSTLGTALMNLAFALIAGCAIMPAVFSFGLSPESGPGLVFEVLPFIFSRMPMGGVVAILFFVALLVAALTSSISMFEAGVAWLVEEKHMTRKFACGVLFVVAWLVGVICTLSFGPLSDIKIFGNIIFDCLDKLSANILMTGGALAIVLFVGWKMRRSDVWDEFSNGGMLKSNSWIFRPMYFIVRYIAPLAILVIFLSSILG